jgi:hypothetical protein
MEASDVVSRLERMNPSAEMSALIGDLKENGSRKLRADELQAAALLTHHGFTGVSDGVGGSIIVEWTDEAANLGGPHSI